MFQTGVGVGRYVCVVSSHFRLCFRKIRHHYQLLVQTKHLRLNAKTLLYQDNIPMALGINIESTISRQALHFQYDHFSWSLGGGHLFVGEAKHLHPRWVQSTTGRNCIRKTNLDPIAF